MKFNSSDFNYRSSYTKLSVVVLLTLATFLAQTPAAYAKPSRVPLVGCPTYVGNEKAKVFINTTGMVCSYESLKKNGMKESSTLVTGKRKYVKSFERAGSGSGNLDAFIVGAKPASITYSFPDESGKGSFRLDLIDVTTGKTVANLVSAHGSVSAGSTLIHQQGAFYLKVSATPSVQVCDSGDGERICTAEDIEWDVSMSFDDLGGFGGGDDFGF